MSKEVIATDIDEVLFPFLREFSGWHNQEYGTQLNPDDFNSYEFNDILGISVPETVHRVHSFLGEEHGFLGVEPVEESKTAIAKLGEQFKIVAITARHPQFKDSSLEYLLQHFRGEIADITLVGTSATVEVVRSKAEVCKELGAIALIDDSITHVLGCAEAGIGGVLFGDYPWNQMDKLPEGVVRHKNWVGVLEHFGVA